jgi:putative ABC transport system permease protein
VVIAGQLAIACVLLLGASLLTRSFFSMLAADRGYDPSNVLTATLSFPGRPGEEAPAADLTAGLIARLRAVPGFTRVAVSSTLPLMPSETLSSFPVRTAQTGVAVQAQAASRVVSPDYFATLGVRIVSGRPFGAEDTPTSKPVVIVNRAFAKKYLGANPVGTKLWDDTPKQQGPEVIGVVEDVRHRGVTDVPAPEIYRVFGQANAGLSLMLAVKTEGRPSGYAQTLRALVRQHDAAIDVDAIIPMETLLSTSLSQPRLYSVLAGALAGLALLVAAVGLFGVLAYAVAQRTREIGVRTALGARPSDIAALVLRQGLAMAGSGLAIGLLVAFAAARSLGALLYGVTADDPVSYVAVPIALLAAAGLACLIPARRAARVDPLTALRQ